MVGDSEAREALQNNELIKIKLLLWVPGNFSMNNLIHKSTKPL